MPRRKAADRAGPVKTRSRSGCQECRTSRVRCDSKKPFCTRCWEKGLPCSTNLVLKWESEFVSRGMAFGRTGVWSKSRPERNQLAGSPSSFPASGLDEQHRWVAVPAIRPWGFINSGNTTFETPDVPDIVLNEMYKPASLAQAVSIGQSTIMYDTNGGVAAQLPGLLSPLSLLPEVSRLGNTDLLDYYLQQVCPRTAATSTTSSPFASVILPFSISASPTLFKAIQALGACHRSRTDPAYGALGLRLKSATLRDLRRRLSDEGSANCCADPEVLVIMMMLCLYEIVDKCDQHWTIHLKGAQDLIQLRRQRTALLSPSTISTDPVSDFAEHFFAFQDVMGRTACGKAKLFESDYWKTDDRQIDLWMGCSPELVAILSIITDLSRARRTLDSDAARELFAARAASLEDQLQHLVQEVGGDVGDDAALLAAAEAKRLAAVIYLHCALYGASPSTPLVANHVHQILRLVSDMLDRGVLPSVTWPIFVAAMELDPSRDEIWLGAKGESISGRSIVLQALAVMTESTIVNIARARAAIVQVWQARDQDLLKTRRQTECNDWEWFVVPVSEAMNLA